MRPAFVRGLPCQGWVASRGIKGGSAPLARSYRGPDNVAGPILGHLNPAVAVVDAVPAPSRLVRRGRPRSGKVKVTRFQSGYPRFRHPRHASTFLIIPLFLCGLLHLCGLIYSARSSKNVTMRRLVPFIQLADKIPRVSLILIGSLQISIDVLRCRLRPIDAPPAACVFSHTLLLMAITRAGTRKTEYKR